MDKTRDTDSVANNESEEKRMQASADDLSASSDSPFDETQEFDDSGIAAATKWTLDAGKRYQILRPHARGGLGEVFVGRDGELNRDVALKQIQDSYADRADCRSRFIKEAEITGRLEHPGVVPIYGLTYDRQGRPFYAMRFIEGRSFKEAILQFHASSKEQGGHDSSAMMLEFRKLLSRFQDVCNTIAYAHSRQVLHRDIKPGNIMLGPYGETLVIDWGLAKIVGKNHEAEAEESTDVDSEASFESPPMLKVESDVDDGATKAGTILGTLGFMSPEQAEGRLDDLGPASDIWSLGATLYFLLVGQSPFAGQSKGEILKNTRSAEPTPPRRIQKSVPPPLEAICLKAMALRPEDRYGTAIELAQEIENWLADEPVSAYREPVGVRWGRWRRRHRTLVASLFILLFTGLSAAALGSWLLSVEQARTRTEKEEKLLVEQEKLAAEQDLLKEQKRLTVEQARTIRAQEDRLVAQNRAERVSKYLFTVLRSPDPSANADAQDIPIGKVLDAALRKVDADFEHDPQMRAEILGELARTYHGLGVPKVAVEVYRRAWDLMKQNRGEGDEQAIRLLNEMAIAMMHVDRPGEAVALLTPFVDQRSELTEVGITSITHLGLALEADGAVAKARALLEKARAARGRLLGADHPETLVAQVYMAAANIDAGEVDIGLPQAREAVAKLEKSKEADEQQVLLASFVLGKAWLAKNDPAAAIPILEENLTRRQKKLGNSHRDTILTIGQLALAYAKVNRFDRALPFLERHWRYWKIALGPEAAATLAALDNLTEAYTRAGHADRALPLVRSFLDGPGNDLPDDAPLAIAFRVRLGWIYEQEGRLREAVSELEAAYFAMRKNTDLYRTEIGRVRESLLRTYLEGRAHAKAEVLLDEVLTENRLADAPNRLDLAETLTKIAACRLHAGKFAEAEAPCRECLALREKDSPGHWSLFDAQSMLGESLLGQKKYAEAETLLLAAQKGLEANAESLAEVAGSHLADSLRRLIMLYDARDDKTRADHWRLTLGERLAGQARNFAGELKAGDAIGYGKIDRGYHQVRELSFEKGRTYLLELTGIINLHLVIEDLSKKQLFNDLFRAEENRRSTALFQPPAGGKYRVIVASREGRLGAYFLRVQEVGTPQPFVRHVDNVGEKDPLRFGKRSKWFPVELRSDRTYLFEMLSPNWTNELTLLDPAGREVLAYDFSYATRRDSGERAAEIFLAPRHAGKYLLNVSNTSNSPTGQGLRITPCLIYRRHR